MQKIISNIFIFFSSIIIWMYWFAIFIFIFLSATICTMFIYPYDPYRRVYSYFILLQAWLMMLPFKIGWIIKFEGLSEFLKTKQRPLICISNHQSFMDIVILNLLSQRMRWIVKKELFVLPFVGWIIYFSKQYGVDRKNPNALSKLYKTSKETSIFPMMIFPEGTRSVDSQVTPFKPGAFILAKKMDAWIQPIAISGCNNMLPARSWFFGLRGSVLINFLNPFQLESNMSIRKAMDYSQALISKHVHA